MAKKRNGKIDLLKFIFAMVVMLHHSQEILSDGWGLFVKGGSFAVEFFFIVSGYLMMESIRRMPNEVTATTLGTETWHFLWRKISSLYPEMLLAWLIAFLVNVTLRDVDAYQLFRESFHGALMLDMTGLSGAKVNGATWYLSSMLLAMTILYPVIRKYPDIMTKIVLPLTALLILGHFCKNKLTPRSPTVWWGLTYKGNLRAIAELSLGVCLNTICTEIKKLRLVPLKSSRILLTVVEYGAYASVLWYMQRTDGSRLDYYYIWFYVVAVAISFSNQGIDAGWYDNKVWYWLGKFSLSVYLCHIFYGQRLGEIFPADFFDEKKLLCYVASALTTALVVMYASDGIRRVWPKCWNRLKKHLFQSETPAQI